MHYNTGKHMQMKNHILAQNPNLKEIKLYYLLSIVTLALLFKKPCDDESDCEAICLAGLAKIVKRDILKAQETYWHI